MKKRKIIYMLVLMLLFEMIAPATVEAKTSWAFTKKGVPCYSDASGSSDAGSISRYSGFEVIEKKGSYNLVKYKKKGKTKTGWISKEDMRDLCLKYDGSEIAMVAEGIYALGGQQIKVFFLGNGDYRLQLVKTKQYFAFDPDVGDFVLSEQKEDQNNLWTFSRVDHHLLIQNRASGKYIIPNGSVIQIGTYKDACKSDWVFVREGTNTDPYRNFCQYDGRWGGKKNGSSTKMAQAGCGVLAPVNAIYALSGQFMEPMQSADYACETGYRVPYSGTDEGYMKAVAKDLGKQYGISYAGKVETISGIKKGLLEGATFVAHVPGHYVAIADYDKKKDKYLVLDPHPLPKRKTSPFGSWVSAERLGSGGLCVSVAFKYVKVENSGFHWDLNMQKIKVVQNIAVNLNPTSERDYWDYLLQLKGRENEKVE
ncbi:MAG: hypothetical protein Q4D45_10200 [Lachnospiraceae bacterium]|nr:hypothetical protein [Lachnospiraceae bacterium]